MFGLSFGELCVLLMVAVVVLGPKELPRYLRKAGQFVGQLRRMAYDMRAKSGIDEVLRTEGLDREIAEIRQLARGELGGVLSAVRSTAAAVRNGPAAAVAAAPSAYAPTELPSPRPSRSIASASTRARDRTRTARCPTRRSSTTVRCPPRRSPRTRSTREARPRDRRRAHPRASDPVRTRRSATSA